jgi:hypothetical protein
METAVMILQSEHLRRSAENVPIAELEIWDIKNGVLPLKTALRMEIIVFQDQKGNTKILKNKYGKTGTLLNHNILTSAGWGFGAGGNAYRKLGQTITLQQGPQYTVQTAMTGEPVLQVGTLLICQEGHKEPLEIIATLEELQAFFKPEDFIIHDNYLN